MTAGRDDKSRTKDRRVKRQKSMAAWREHRQKVRQKKRAQRKENREAHRP